jgi:hypothetical protein
MGFCYEPISVNPLGIRSGQLIQHGGIEYWLSVATKQNKVDTKPSYEKFERIL